jgi:peroxiredoxin
MVFAKEKQERRDVVKRIIAVVILVFLAGMAIYQNQTDEESAGEEYPEIGFAAPSFMLTGLDQMTYAQKGSRQKPLIINFWASWCGPCRQEAPDIKAVYDDFKDEIDFYAINATVDDDVEAAMNFVEEEQFSFPVLFDMNGKVSKSYQVISIPTTYVIDQNGFIRHKIVGMADKAVLEKYVKELIH